MKIINSLKFFFKTKEISLIDNKKSYNLSVPFINQSNEIGLDTEFIWKNTYFPVLSLIQVSTVDKIFIFDCMNLDNLDSLNDIFNNPKIKKIFHSMRGDLTVLYNSLDSDFNNLFDTQIAEGIISNSENQISYKNLVKNYFYKELPKTETNSNWQNRPLSIDQINYASDDVTFLIDIMKNQKKIIDSKSLKSEFDLACLKEKKISEESFVNSRLNRLVKKNRNISNLEKKIFIWRENEAKRRNVPPNNVFRDKELKRLKNNIESKNFNEFKWIIENEESRSNFLLNFR